MEIQRLKIKIMGKISAANAQEVARKCVEPINKKIQEVNKEIKELLTGYYRETVPVEVMKFWKKSPEWFYTASSVYVQGIGLVGNYNSESIENLPKNTGSTPNLNMSKEQASLYVKLIDKKSDLKGKLKTTQKEIEATILALGTHKKVIEQLPELAQFFPESDKSNMQLMIQVGPVHEKIKCLVSPEVEKKCIEKL